jgi:Xaa-Pro dipeptidase
MLAEQLERLQKIVWQARLDTIALVPGSNLRYLTGISFHLLERPFIIFIPAEGEPAIVVPALEMKQLQETGFPGTYFPWTDAEGYANAFTEASKTLNLADKNIGVEGLRMRVKESQLIQHYAPGSQIIDADEALIDLRIVKSSEEVEFHRRAVRISEQALSQLLEELQIGMTERQIARRLSELQIELGGAGDSFNPTVLVGPRSALPHGQPGDASLQQGDALLIDFGTVYKGHVSDITRTFFVGEPSARSRAVYEAVLAANTTGREAAKPGTTGHNIDTQTTQALKDTGFEDYIKHRTGHGLGIDIHEHPNISQGETRPLEPGMVFTIEPGLYAEGELGVRIEDNVVITKDGAESLTTFPRELKVLNL